MTASKAVPDDYARSPADQSKAVGIDTSQTWNNAGIEVNFKNTYTGPRHLIITNLVSINLEDGSFTTHDGYTPDAAAQAFWQAVSLEYQDFLRWKSEQTKKTEARMTSDVLSQRVTEEIERLKVENERLLAKVRSAHAAGYWFYCGPSNAQELELVMKDEQKGWEEWERENLSPAQFPSVSGGE